MKLSDQTMLRTVAFPAANANVSTTYNDLGAVNVGPVGANIEVHFKFPALPNLADAHTITADLTHCDTSGGSYVVVPGTGNMSVTGAGGVGSAATEFRFYLPPDTKRYVAAKITVPSGGGDSTASTFTLEFRI